MSSALFFKYNTQLGPPYQVLVDTNFINFSIKNKVGVHQRQHTCLCAQLQAVPFSVRSGLLPAARLPQMST